MKSGALVCVWVVTVIHQVTLTVQSRYNAVGRSTLCLDCYTYTSRYSAVGCSSLCLGCYSFTSRYTYSEMGVL